ncbi:hypothetical protein HS99_0038700 [Kitasatospora aureofaciens]|uniref:Uncharacterized protein n=2 Tax=Kitasatospora aureofaciens TaxID=1894 RepID=A0A1E7MYV3_KITAU|nr:hypothetical protein [Kitasatospora aureofaciens]ARF77523.1 hypothetical protein B6264_00015 [Kitasatospora aureofaciens]OEV33630.1 hypothetical protein HS99_0038700 [Kitasatospora aureofaciens]GGV08235.1 hypothetical protein GCM10010502_74040 [Kitasatospora aureofaciens]
MKGDAVLVELCERLPVLAGEYGLHMVPAVPEDHPGRAEVDGEAMTVDEFCGLARAAGARVLFHRTTAFDADAFLAGAFPEDDDDPDALSEAETASVKAVERVRRRARRHDGQIVDVQLCVVLDGVAVFWSRLASWAAALADDAEKAQDEKNDMVEQIRTSRARDEQAEVTRISRLLQDDPTFREAKDPQARRRAADRLVPRPDEMDFEARRIRTRAIQEAISAIEEAADAIFSEYMTQLPELADELVASGALDGARTIPARKVHLKEFLRKRSGGHTPPVDLITLMMELPQLRNPSSAAVLPAARQPNETLFPMEQG